MNIWSLQDGSLLQTNTGTGGVHSLTWLGETGLAVCFGRSKVMPVYSVIYFLVGDLKLLLMEGSGINGC